MGSQEEQPAKKHTANILHLYRQWMEKNVSLQDIVITEASFRGTKEQLEQIAAKTFVGAEGVHYHIETAENGQLMVFIYTEEKAKPAWSECWQFWRRWKKK
jgi:hypothetical protein